MCYGYFLSEFGIDKLNRKNRNHNKNRIVKSLKINTKLSRNWQCTIQKK